MLEVKFIPQSKCSSFQIFVLSFYSHRLLEPRGTNTSKTINQKEAWTRSNWWNGSGYGESSRRRRFNCCRAKKAKTRIHWKATINRGNLLTMSSPCFPFLSVTDEWQQSTERHLNLKYAIESTICVFSPCFL